MTERPDPNAGTETSTPHVPVVPPGGLASPASDPNVVAPASATPQAGPPAEEGVDRPRLARLFSEQLSRLKLTAEGDAHHGAMPDVELDPAELDPALVDELVGLKVSIPAVKRFGVLGGLRPTGEDAFTVILDDETFEIPHAARLHVSSRSWREAHEGPVPQLTDELPASPLHGEERSPERLTGPGDLRE